MTESSSTKWERNSEKEKSKESSLNEDHLSNYREIFRIACEKGQMDTVKFLIKQSGILKNEFEDKKRPIHLAVDNQHWDIVGLLIDEGSDIECEDKHKWRPIHYACSNGNERIVELLIDKKCLIECTTEDMDSAMHIACKNGHAHIVEILLARNCDIYCQNNQNETPLGLAVKHHHEDCVTKIECFIKTKIVECIRNNDESRFSEMYGKLISNTDTIHYEISIWDIAVSNGANKIIKYLKRKILDDEELKYLTKTFDNITNADTDTSLGEMILSRCIRDRQTEGFHRFCSAEIVNGQQTTKSSFLSKAAKYGRCIFVHELLRKSVYKKETWDIAINDATVGGHKEIAEDISNRRQLIEGRSKRGFSLLHTAVFDNDADMVKYILEKNIVDADINHEIFGTALALAHSLYHINCISILEQFNVDTNTQNKFMQTPLHEAIASGTIEKCQYLIERCDNINREGFKDMTALHCAVMEGHVGLCEQLLQHGADWMKYCEPLPEFVPRVPSLAQSHEAKTSRSECSHPNDAETPLEIHIQSDENNEEINNEVIEESSEFLFNKEMFTKIVNTEIMIDKDEMSTRNILASIANHEDIKEISKKIIDFLSDLYDQRHSNDDAMQKSWECLYILCQINKISIDYRFSHSFFMKYFKGNFSKKIKLAAVVAHCYYQESDYDNFEETIIFLFDVLKNFGENNTNEDFVFTKEEIINCVNVRITMLINLFIIDQGLGNCSSTHQILKVISANLGLCPTIPVLPMMNIITKCFDRNYRIPIAEKIKNQTDLDDNDHLAVDCLCLSLHTITKYIERHSSTNYNYNDYIITNIFDTFSKCATKNTEIKRICEAILYLFCNVLNMSNTKINYEFWNKGLMMFVEDKSWSNVIRVRACMTLTKINFMRNLSSSIETKLKIVKCFFTEIIIEEDKRKLYVVEKGEIIHAIGDALKILSTVSKMIFHSDEGLDNRLEYVNDILCLLIQIGPNQQNGFFSSILKFTQPILTSITIQFKRSVVRKFKENICLNKRERTLINCFCNSLNIIGQISSRELCEPFLKDVYDTIYACLGAFEEFIHGNIYAVRICEVLLYCLCNVIQNRKFSENDKWSDILWRYYNQCTSSKQIKMAAAVCLVYAIKKDELKDKITKIEIFFNENQKKVNINYSQSYLGFSLQEIDDAILRCRGQTKHDKFEFPSKNNILTLTTQENAATLCLKMNKKIYSFLSSNVTEGKCCDAANNSLLHLAAVCLIPELCKSLVGKNYSINEVNNEGNNCLQELLLNIEESEVDDNIDRIIDTVTILMESGIDLNAKTRTGMNIFQLASRLNNEKLLRALLTEESVLFITKNDFELSFKSKWYKYGKRILKKLPEDRLSKSFTADIYKEYLHDSPAEIIKIMFDKSDEAVQKSVLDDVVYYGAKKEDDDLFDKFKNLETLKLFANGETLLTQLIREKRKPYYMKLITSNNNWKYIDVSNVKNQTPLQIAIEMEQIDLVDKLIVKTKTINSQDNDGETALTQLLKKILTCDATIKDRLYTALESMIIKCVNIYHITSEKNVLKKNVKDMIGIFTITSPSNTEQILDILTNEKCEMCDTRAIEYVYQCGHKFCTDCGNKFEECPLEKEK